MLRVLLTCMFLFFGLISYSQSVLTPLSDFQFHWVDRIELLEGKTLPDLHSSFKPYWRDALVEISGDRTLWSQTDDKNFRYLHDDNPDEKKSNVEDLSTKKKKSFYARSNAFYAVDVPDFNLILNPVAGFGYGRESLSDLHLYQNTRGVEMRGSLAGKVGFYSYLTENQQVLPEFMRKKVDEDGVLPGAGLIKPFSTNGLDFFTARGYFTLKPLKVMNLQFGHDRNFIGNGFRSMIWSDHSREHLFLKLQTRVWKFQYTNLFAELSDLDRLSGSGGNIDRKYAAVHHLSLNLGKKVNIGFFETVIFDRGNKGFEANYLNPIIFYRAVEHTLNSSDNVLIGLDVKVIPVRKVSVYGQFLLDEFVKDELISRSGWWANKWALQGGVKYIDLFGIQNLDLQGEFNMARPFTYTHFNRAQNYIHQNQPLAHPLGANFKEGVFILRYQPTFKLNVQFTGIYYARGKDSSQTSMTYGGNILRTYDNRVRNYENITGQGLQEKVLFTEISLSYQWYHNIFTDLRVSNRAVSGDFVSENLLIQTVLRVNLFGRTPYEFKY